MRTRHKSDILFVCLYLDPLAAQSTIINSTIYIFIMASPILLEELPETTTLLHLP